MKHDFHDEPTGLDEVRFCDWLLSETTNALARDYGDGEATKASIFLFVNRAFEAQLPDSKIAEMFGIAIAHAGYEEQDEESASAWLESFAQIARDVHRRHPTRRST